MVLEDRALFMTKSKPHARLNLLGVGSVSLTGFLVSTSHCPPSAMTSIG